MLKVLHLSTTPLVGAPGNLCRALNESGVAQARWAVLDDEIGTYRTMAVPIDMAWRRDRDQIIQLAESSDLLHLHNFIDLQTSSFAPLDFAALWARGKPMVRHFHSQSGWVARHMGTTVDAVQACPIPKLAIAQYPERSYPASRLVRNLVYVPDRAASVPGKGPVRVGYAPSRFNSAHSSRWDTKGYPETVAMLRRMQRLAARRGVAVELDLIEQVSHAECLRRKAACDLFVDDLVTGSYHLNTLEALAMGVPCAAYLDDRTRAVVREMTGGPELPVINVGLEDAAEVLLQACARPNLLPAMGSAARAWMRRHWSPGDTAAELGRIYQAVLASPRQPFAPRFDPADPLAEWAVRGEHDARWEARRQHWPSAPNPWVLKVRGAAGRVARALGR